MALAPWRAFEMWILLCSAAFPWLVKSLLREHLDLVTFWREDLVFPLAFSW